MSATPQAHPASWRAVWAYSRSRAVRDTKTLTAQENRARDVITGGTAARMPRFVKTAKGRFVLDQAALARARRLADLKGYVTNIPATVMPATEVSPATTTCGTSSSRSACPKQTSPPDPCSPASATPSKHT
jgi:hypothetical protein